MHIGEKLRHAIRLKGLDMEEAASKLELSRTTLYNKLNRADVEPEFVQLVQERLHINVDTPELSSHQGVNEKQIGGVVLKYHTIPLKKKRTAEMWLPNDLDKGDVKTIGQWLELMESTL